MSTRYTDGSVTVTLDDGLARFVRGLLSAAELATVERLEAIANEVAADARREWYGPNGVERETGLSGDIQVKTIIDGGRGRVIVRAGSTDPRKAGKTGKPVVVYVHRKGGTVLVRTQVTHEEYWATTKSLRANYHPYKANKATGWQGDPPGSGPFVWKRRAESGDGKFLLPELVRKPLKGKIRFVAAELGRDIVRTMEANRGR